MLKKIKKNFKSFNPFSFQKVGNNNVYQLLKNTSKAMGCDLIQLKLVKIVADQFAEPLTCIINSAFTQSIFPNKAKEASDTPFDKGENSKHKFLEIY